MNSHRSPSACWPVVLLCLLLPTVVWAQPTGHPPAEKPPGAGDAGKKDRVVHEEELFFSVKFRKDLIGWSHYTLDKIVDGTGGRKWTLATEWQMTPAKGLPVPNSGRTTAVLGEKFDLIQADWGGYARDVEVRYKAQIMEGVGELMVDMDKKGSAKSDGRWTETDWGIESMIGKFLLQKGLAEGKTYGFHTLAGDGIALNDITIQVKGATALKTDVGSFNGFECVYTSPPMPPIQTEPLTWTVVVDEKGRVVHASAGDLEYSLADEQIMDNPMAPFAARGRRDPFRNPMIPKPIAGSGTGPKVTGITKTPGKKTLDADTKKEMLQNARDLLATMQRDNADPALPRENRLDLLGKNYDQLAKLSSKGYAEEQADVKFIDAMKKIVTSAQEIYSGVERLAADISRLHGEADKAFEAHRFTDLQTLTNDAQAIASNPVIRDTRYAHEIQAHNQAIKDLRERGKKHEAFALKKPQIMGIIYYLVPEPITFLFGVEILGRRVAGEHTAEIARSRSSAILKIGNDTENFEEGKTVDPDTRIQKIERGAVVFLYQGEQIKVELGADSK